MSSISPCVHVCVHLLLAAGSVDRHSCRNLAVEMLEDHPHGRKYIGNSIAAKHVEWDSRVFISSDYSKIHFEVVGGQGKGKLFAHADKKEGNEGWTMKSLVLEVSESNVPHPPSLLVPIYPSEASAAAKLASSVTRV